MVILLNALRGVAGKKCTPRKSLRGAAALNGRLPPEDGSNRPQTSGKRVSGDPRHFIFRPKKFFSKLRTAVYPPKTAPIGVKLQENAFQVIPNISFFDENIFCRNFERPFTPRGWLRSASNLVKTRFRRSPTFHFATVKKSIVLRKFRNFWSNEVCWRRKMKCWGSSETRFPKV